MRSNPPTAIRRDRATWVLHTVGRTALIAGAATWLVPLLIVVLTALRSESDVLRNGAVSFPHGLTLSNFPEAWQTGGFSTLYRHSLLITIVKVPLGVLAAALISYALVKLRLPFSGVVLLFILIGLTIPTYVALLPLFLVLRNLNLISTIWGLIPPYIAFGLPFEILVLRAYFKGIPDELLDAAWIDGASELHIFFRIMLPLSLPVLAAVCIIDAVGTWNELLIALVMLSSNGNFTVPLGLLNFQGEFSTNFTGLNAAIVMAVFPILILYLLLQRYLISGLTTGAVKA